MPKGSLFVLSAPSGCGKTTLADDVIKNNDNIVRSVSYTTRAKRKNEIADVDYHFIDEDAFLSKSENGDFLESATVFGNYYGTCANWAQIKLAAGIDIICAIDCEGAKQIKSEFPEAVLIFIMPPSKEALVDRLQKRAADSEQAIIERLGFAKSEVMQSKEFDYIVINDDLKLASKQIASIIQSSRLREHMQQDITTSIINGF